MKILFVIIVFVLISILNGCGPSVHVQRLKPAEVDMSSMRRIVVPDFDYYHGDVDSVGDFFVGLVVESVGLHYGEDYQIREAASYALDELLSALRSTRYFELLDSTALQNVKVLNAADVEKIGRTLGAEAILVGDINYAGCEIKRFFKEEKSYDAVRKQNVILQTPWLRQNCRLTFSYRVIRVAGNILEIQKRFSEYI